MKLGTLPQVVDSSFLDGCPAGAGNNYLYLNPQHPLHISQRSRPTYSSFFLCLYSCVPGGPNLTCSEILYVVNYIVYGLLLFYKLKVCKDMCRNFISQHPGLGPGLLDMSRLKFPESPFAKFGTVPSATLWMLPGWVIEGSASRRVCSKREMQEI